MFFFLMIARRINNLDLLSSKPKFTFRNLKKGVQDFQFVLAPADKATNNVVVV